MPAQRPSPDALLAKVREEEEKARRGRLKIFFGAGAGVGKTYPLLSAARYVWAEGEDVVVGVVETHGRSETAALLGGLEVLPPRVVEYRGARLREFDLDGALKRHPAVILVDELAHTNAPGSRHPKRWNDVEELLDAGIDVYTAINVQHIESLNDVVGSITGVRVWETVPDTVFERADEVELVDLPPEELIDRLREGKIYLPQQAKAAIENFFRKGNLMALRELALRRTAERVDEQMRDYREDHAISEVWHAAERILVCIGPGELGERLVRAGRRLATSLHADWIVAYVETPRLARLPAVERDAILENLRLGERLGAMTATLSSAEMASAILEYAHRENVTKIVLGKPSRTGWRRWLMGSVVDALMREASDIDVHILGGEQVEQTALVGEGAAYLSRSRAYLGLSAEARQEGKKRWPGYAVGVAVVVACTLVGWSTHGILELVNLVMVYLLGVLVVAMRFGRGPSILASVLSVAAFDFFFVPPYLTFAVSDTQYLVVFAVMLMVAMVISNLTANLRTQARVAGHREKRAQSLYAISRDFTVARTEEEIIRAAVKHIGIEFECQNVILLPDAQGRILYPRGESQAYSLHGTDLGVAQWVFDHGQPAGRGTDTLAGAEATYFPLAAAAGTVGVLAILPVNLRRVFLPEQRRLIETILNQIALAIERVRLAHAAQVAKLRVETESLRNSLLAAIAHDLRTPLASIVGASSSLAEGSERLTSQTRAELSRAIYDEAQRMAGLTNNILDMARLEGGTLALNRDWYPLEEIVGAALTRLRMRLGERPVRLDLPADLPLLRIDAVLVEQVFINLLENALKYTPSGSPIEIGATASAEAVSVTVADRGPGIPAGSEERIFEKFFRGEHEGAQSGVGLGLAICRAIVAAHGGRIWVENRDGGGAAFRFTLLRDAEPPPPEPEEPLAGPGE